MLSDINIHSPYNPNRSLVNRSKNAGQRLRNFFVQPATVFHHVLSHSTVQLRRLCSKKWNCCLRDCQHICHVTVRCLRLLATDWGEWQLQGERLHVIQGLAGTSNSSRKLATRVLSRSWSTDRMRVMPHYSPIKPNKSLKKVQMPAQTSYTSYGPYGPT